MIESHEMTYDGECWRCPICGRVICIDPLAERVVTVIAEGNPNASHFGGNGMMDIGVIVVADDPIDPFREWAEAMDPAAKLDDPEWRVSE